LAKDDVLIRIWGGRGSVACPGPKTVRYGGNTACVEVRCGPHLVIFDGGTGIRELGKALTAEAPVEADVFLTHFHLDHIAGLPFFATAYDARNRVHFHAARLDTALTLKTIVARMMSPPLFPVPVDEYRADVDFVDFSVGDRLEPHPGLVLETRALCHPGGACGYRLSWAGRTIAYVTDTEHPRDGSLDPNVQDLMAGADVAIYDATFTDAEYACYQGWGHSTWREGVRAADAAGVGTLVLFHHDPAHDDDAMDRIAADAEAARPGTLVAQDGMTLRR
jgi:phosphoribosyl 1,2-cyclic phosphodiesterase